MEDKKIVARYLIKRFWMTDNVKSFLVSDELSENTKNEFISYLIYKRNFPVAREVWLSKLKNENVSLNQPIFDGGFENITESDESGFGWQIDQKMSAIAVARDDRNVHSGSSAILIKFAGNVELNRPIVSQLAFVEPNRKYQLRFFYRSTELISAGQPAIVIRDGVSNEILGRSARLRKLMGLWVESKLNFVANHHQWSLSASNDPHATPAPAPFLGKYRWMILSWFN